MNLIFLESNAETVKLIAMILGFVGVIASAVAGFIFFVWWLVYGKKQKHWQDLSLAQEKKINFLEGEMKDLKIEMQELKQDFDKSERRAKRCEEREENLRKENLKLKGFLGDE